MTQTVLDARELHEFLTVEFPQIADQLGIEDISPMRARMRLHCDDRHLRPGGTVSGPSIMLLADVTFYVAILAMIGREALTVTTNMNLTFLRKPAKEDLLCDARILKLGRRLVSGDCLLYSATGSPDEPVAQATVTYARP
jgi:uncharacterized protein (TIGR00369 family)